MTYAPPARCPGCGAVYTLTLISDPGTPVYACGSTPNRIVCTMLRPVPVDAIDNLTWPTDAERDWLQRLGVTLLIDGLGDAAAPTVPRVTWCAVEGCDAAAIDGLCNLHWNDDAISVGLAALA